MRFTRPTTWCAALLAGVLSACAATSVGPDASPAAPAAPAPVARGSTTVEGWPVRTPRQVGLRGRALERGAKQAKRLDSTCFAVLRDGKLVGEWNWQQRREVPREVFSITKSITSTLVGIAVRDGDIRVDDRVSSYLREWRGTPSKEVTVRHLLSNDSGRWWSMQSDYGDLLGARNRTRYAMRLPQQHPPGSAWAYNNAAIQVLEEVLERATGMPVERYARTRLFEPLGMTRTRLTTDPAGNTNVFYGAQTTCLDLAHLGMLYLGRGRVDGRRYVDRSWVAQAVGRPSTTHNAAYGLLWWLNRPGALRGPTDAVDEQGQPVTPVTGQLAADAPEDVFAAIGFGGQVLLVDPGSRTMVIRLGAPAQPGAEAYAVGDAATVLTRALR